MGRLILLSDLEASSFNNDNLKHITAIPVACKNNQLINYSYDAKFKRGVIYGTGSFGGTLHQSLSFPWSPRAAPNQWVSQVQVPAKCLTGFARIHFAWLVNIHLSGIVFQLFVLCPVHLSLSRTIESNGSEKNKTSVYYLETIFSEFGPR